jgi:hypothetical protein
MPSEPAPARRGARLAGMSPLLGAVAGMLAWALHFTVAYGVTALACARGLADRTVLGLPLVTALVAGATALALAATAVVAARAARRLQGGLSGEAGEDDPRFTAWLGAAVALLAALAILWQTVPALVLRPCG